MRNIIIITLCCALLAGSCTPPESKETRVILLDKLEHSGMVDIDLALKLGYYRYALIQNPPSTPDSLKMIIRHYSDSLINKSSVEGSYAQYYLKFYNYSDDTKGYMEGRGGMLDTHTDILQELPDYRGEYRYEACGADSLHGTWSLEVELGDYHRRDTIVNNCKFF